MSFQLVRAQAVPSLDLHYQEFRHPSGLRHLHLASAGQENAFAIAFPTANPTHDGRAHVLEHLVLCGSRRFDVHNPFTAMTRRSLASFMNAFTYSDRTLYPFSTSDQQDFFNLLDVYLDTTFFPLLRRKDFLQEGWRLGFDAQGQPEFTGVVFNEMKGALADRQRWSYHLALQALTPGTPEAVVSGGDPVAIPDLTHETLKAFHQTYYHPAQAVLLSHGPIDPGLVQARVLEILADRLDEPAPSPDHFALQAPAQREHRVPVWTHPGDTDLSLVRGWVVGPGYQGDRYLKTLFATHVLMGSDHAPLRKLMSEQPFGRPSSLNMALTDHAHMSVLVGMDGLDSDTLPQARALLDQEIERLAREGVAASELASALQEFQLMARGEATDFPQGVHYLVEMAPFALGGGDPLAAIDPDRIDALAEVVLDPAFIRDWVRIHLLENPHQVVLELTPDAQAPQRQLEQLQERLAAHVASLGPEGLARAKAEDEQVQQPGNPDVSALPCLDLERLSRDPEPLAAVQVSTDAGVLHAHAPASVRGISHVQLMVDVAALSPADLDWVSLLADFLPSLGQAGKHWAQTSAWRAEHLPGFSAQLLAAPTATATDRLGLRLMLEAQCLDERAGALATGLREALLAPEFDDPERITFLLEERLAQARERLSSMGFRLAMVEARQHLGPVGAWEMRRAGRQQLAFLQQRLEQVKRDPTSFIRELHRIHAMVLTLPAGVLSWGSQAARAAGDLLASTWAGPSMRDLSQSRGWDSEGTPTLQRLLTGPTAVQFCLQAWAGPGRAEQDSVLLELLAQGLDHGILHAAIREQGGAYGAGARMSSQAFLFYSYRDPRLSETFADFERAQHWACSNLLSEQALREAKLAVLQSWQPPSTPGLKAQKALSVAMTDMEEPLRQQLRTWLLDATAEQIQGAAQRWIQGPAAARVAFTNDAKAQDPILAEAGWEPVPAWPAAAGRGMKP